MTYTGPEAITVGCPICRQGFKATRGDGMKFKATVAMCTSPCVGSNSRRVLKEEFRRRGVKTNEDLT